MKLLSINLHYLIQDASSITKLPQKIVIFSWELIPHGVPCLEAMLNRKIVRGSCNMKVGFTGLFMASKHTLEKEALVGLFREYDSQKSS